MKLKVCVWTDPGYVRERNEDAFLVMEEQGLFIVADGMGGHLSGDEASRLAVETVRKWFEGEGPKEENGIERLKGLLGLKTNSEVELYRALEEANRKVYELGKLRDPKRGIGTTIVAGLIHGSTLFIAYSGDSRAYRYRGGRLTQLTEDHSLLNQYLKEHRITQKEAPFFPYRSVIVKALGLFPECQAEFRRTRIKPGDIYLFCTDGLTDMVNDEGISMILEQNKDFDHLCVELVDAALSMGGLDNITVLAIKILEV